LPLPVDMELSGNKARLITALQSNPVQGQGQQIL
jgi:hypothetical protein